MANQVEKDVHTVDGISLAIATMIPLFIVALWVGLLIMGGQVYGH